MNMEYTEKQIQIIDAAERLFAEKGFSGTSVRDIAESAGVNLAMISYYFGSKEKLMEAMFSYRGKNLHQQLQNIVQDGNLDPWQKVEKLIDDYITRIFQKQCFYKIMVREQIVDKEGPISKQVLQLKQNNQALISQLIQEGQKKGVFKKNVEIPFLMMSLVGTTSQLVNSFYYYKVSNNLQHLSDEEFEKSTRKKLSAYLKTVFKAVLKYES